MVISKSIAGARFDGGSILGLALLVLAFAAFSCGSVKSQSGDRLNQEAAATPSPTQQVFQVKGVIEEFLPADHSVRIKHEAIPNYMPAMTMPFEVKATNELAGLIVGDPVSFRLTVTATEGWIDQIKKLERPLVAPPKPNSFPKVPGIHFVRDVDPLNVGDPLPDYRFTNQMGQAIQLSQYRGQALAFTFIFTRCPFPTFCPLMSNNFRQVQDGLNQLYASPTNWHLFTISFDPDWDSPERLKAYAEGMHHDPRHWSFLTGDLVEITALAEQVGEVFARDANGTGINHNLRTVVVDAQGRIQKIIRENKWTPDELVAELIKAAKTKP